MLDRSLTSSIHAGERSATEDILEAAVDDDLAKDLLADYHHGVPRLNP